MKYEEMKARVMRIDSLIDTAEELAALSSFACFSPEQTIKVWTTANTSVTIKGTTLNALLDNFDIIALAHERGDIMQANIKHLESDQCQNLT